LKIETVYDKLRAYDGQGSTKTISAFKVDCEGVYRMQEPVTAAITVLEDATRQVSCPQMGNIADEVGSCQYGQNVRDRLRACLHLNPKTEVFEHVTD